jgi:hypothetical protein
MNKDFRLSTGFIAHPKTVKLRRRIGADGVLSLISLFGFTAQNKPDGQLTGMSDEDLAIAAGWDGEPAIFISALMECRFLDDCDGHFAVHDWAMHNGWAANAQSRSEQSRSAAEQRWKRKSAMPTDANSNAVSIDQHSGQNGSALPIDANSNAPIPSPLPSPSPSPNPKGVQGETQTEPSDDAKRKAPASVTPEAKVDQAIAYLNQVFPPDLAEYIAQTIRTDGMTHADPNGYFVKLVGSVRALFTKATPPIVQAAWESARNKGAGIGWAKSVVNSEIKRALAGQSTLPPPSYQQPSNITQIPAWRDRSRHPARMWEARESGKADHSDRHILAACAEYRRTLPADHADPTLDRLQRALENRLGLPTTV